MLRKEWADYFPHVGEGDLRQNYHKRLDALQVNMNLYIQIYIHIYIYNISFNIYM